MSETHIPQIGEPYLGSKEDAEDTAAIVHVVFPVASLMRVQFGMAGQMKPRVIDTEEDTP